MKRAGNLLLAIGVGLILLMAYGHYRTERIADGLMEELRDLPFEQLQVEDNAMPEPIAIVSDDQFVSKKSESADNLASAILEIPAIELKVPVVEGAGQKELKAAVGHLTQSGAIGKEGGNVALAGHRSRVFGQYFNRLDELEDDDIIVLTTKRNVYTYQVTVKKVVKPTQVEVLDPVPGRTLLTLITCHPLRSNQQRLIIIAERVDVIPVKTT